MIQFDICAYAMIVERRNHIIYVCCRLQLAACQFSKLETEWGNHYSLLTIFIAFFYYLYHLYLVLFNAGKGKVHVLYCKLSTNTKAFPCETIVGGSEINVNIFKRVDRVITCGVWNNHKNILGTDGTIYHIFF